MKSFSEEQENFNKKKKTSYDLKLFHDFLASEEERRKIEEANKLKVLAIKFLLGVRKNQIGYEPLSLECGSFANHDNFAVTDLKL